MRQSIGTRNAAGLSAPEATTTFEALLEKLAAAVAVLVYLVAAPATAAAQHAQHYVLDAFGGVHAGGGAPVISPATPYFGFDVAADIEFVPVGTATAAGDGILVLDKFGGVHKGGALAADPPIGGTPYFGFDAARAIAYRDIPPRAEGAASSSNLLLTSASYSVIRSETVRAPDDGYLLVTATAGVFCQGASGNSTAQFSLNVDSVGGDGTLDAYYSGFPNCMAASPGLGVPVQTVALTKIYPVSAGSHTVNFLGRWAAGTTGPAVSGQSITVIFIDQDGAGGS